MLRLNLRGADCVKTSCFFVYFCELSWANSSNCVNGGGADSSFSRNNFLA